MQIQIRSNIVIQNQGINAKVWYTLGLSNNGVINLNRTDDIIIIKNVYTQECVKAPFYIAWKQDISEIQIIKWDIC